MPSFGKVVVCPLVGLGSGRARTDGVSQGPCPFSDSLLSPASEDVRGLRGVSCGARAVGKRVSSQRGP